VRRPTIVYFRDAEREAWGDPTPVSGEWRGPHPELPDCSLVYASTTVYPKGAELVIRNSGLFSNEEDALDQILGRKVKP
jgi:hypothetical protein